jgi:hypothetical protein
MTTEEPDMSETIRRLDALSSSDLDSVDLGDDSLLAVVRAESAGLKARLYACEILLRRGLDTFLGVIGARSAAGLYASALREGVTTDLNPWAFLGMGDLGPMGLHVVACGESAVEALSPLLNIESRAGLYSGSAEAKIGDSDRARVCDFAAFFISKIRQLPFQFHRDDFALRDAEVERLKESLRESP